MEKWNSDGLVSALGWRYAVKKFDPSRKLSAGEWATLKRALVLTPSSYGLQPWKFLHVADRNLLKLLTPASWNQPQVEGCSHFLVLCRHRKFSEGHIDKYIARIAEVRGVAVSSLESSHKMMVDDLIVAGRSKVIDQWASNQIYIAIGNLMTCAAALGIDTCPMEGIEPDKYDVILNLESLGLRAVVACAIGFRSADDKYASAKKVRYSESDVIVTL